MAEVKRGPYRKKNTEPESAEQNENLSEAEKTGQRIRKRMMEYGLTQGALAEELGMSTASINGILNGTKPIPSSCLRQLSDTLHLSLDYLFGLNDSPTINEDVKAAEKITGLDRETLQRLNLIRKTHRRDLYGTGEAQNVDLNLFLSSPYFNELINTFNQVSYNAEELSAMIDTVSADAEENKKSLPLDTTRLRVSLYEYGIAANKLASQTFHTDEILRKASNINELFLSDKARIEAGEASLRAGKKERTAF